MEAQHCAYKDEEGRELDEHGPGLDYASVPQNCWNSKASHGRRTSQEFCSINPPSTFSAGQEVCGSTTKKQAWHWYKDVHESC